MVNVLGEDYNVLFCNADSMSDKDNYGECDRYTKTIKINKDIFNGEGLTDNIQGVINKTIRHELFHAIFHEAGLDEYAEDETLVDALAILYPKITRIINYIYIEGYGECVCDDNSMTNNIVDVNKT